jgi:DNA-binding transcriptional regulator of glucitol operon
MSLKAFHVVFITAASAMSFGVGGWMLRAYRSPEGSMSDLVFGIGFILTGAGLLVYERYFLKKTKKESYL